MSKKLLSLLEYFFPWTKVSKQRSRKCTGRRAKNKVYFEFSPLARVARPGRKARSSRCSPTIRVRICVVQYVKERLLPFCLPLHEPKFTGRKEGSNTLSVSWPVTRCKVTTLIFDICTYWFLRASSFCKQLNESEKKVITPFHLIGIPISSQRWTLAARRVCR